MLHKLILQILGVMAGLSCFVALIRITKGLSELIIKLYKDIKTKRYIRSMKA